MQNKGEGYMDKYFEKITILETLGVYILVNILVFLSTLVINVDSKSAINGNLLGIINEVLLITYIIYRLNHNNFKLKEAVIDFKNKPQFKDSLIIFILHAILALTAALGIAYIIYKINPELTKKMLNDKIIENNGAVYDNIYAFILGVILAPIMEELIFRGIMFNRLKMRWGAGPAIIISSIIFGMLHMDLAIIGAVLFGIMMCILYMKTRNIITTMTVHFINNLIFISMSIGKQENISQGDITEIISIGKIALILFAVSSVISIYYIVKNWPKKEKRSA
ncbi:CAAX protease [Clostridium botulinum]|uniref:CAAX protease n=2 Tax=Clostridium botulinum TaxID=1491 RepID=A0A9Q1UX30_CLOBO|nr:CAAX amino terminal protease family protein [Clostridium botulinum BKT015925]KEI01384.1 CAAX protease [Clostridium botulinum C/D str. Sp77]KOA72861.1 CAAX protease [Clostridium botulinum]MCD3198700.1 CPBP family intramembrane metalloprotease [Clostridium botulinum C/D]KOA82113.1 CAAX protease [Clostridium botulinum]